MLQLPMTIVLDRELVLFSSQVHPFSEATTSSDKRPRLVYDEDETAQREPRSALGW